MSWRRSDKTRQPDRSLESRRFPGTKMLANIPTRNFGMIVGSGIDIVETPRVERALERHGERFSKRLYTPGEIAYCERAKNRAERYAARFAAKEAAFKALGTGWGNGVRWLDVEVIRQPSGKPELLLTGRARELARGLGVKRTTVSLSHSDRYAVAQVIFESDD